MPVPVCSMPVLVLFLFYYSGSGGPCIGEARPMPLCNMYEINYKESHRLTFQCCLFVFKVCVRACMRVCMHACVCVRVCVCLCVSIYTCLCEMQFEAMNKEQNARYRLLVA